MRFSQSSCLVAIRLSALFVFFFLLCNCVTVKHVLNQGSIFLLFKMDKPEFIWARDGCLKTFQSTFIKEFPIIKVAKAWLKFCLKKYFG